MNLNTVFPINANYTIDYTRVYLNIDKLLILFFHSCKCNLHFLLKIIIILLSIYTSFFVLREGGTYEEYFTHHRIIYYLLNPQSI